MPTTTQPSKTKLETLSAQYCARRSTSAVRHITGDCDILRAGTKASRMQGADSMANPGKHVQWERNQPSAAATIAKPASRDKKVARREDAGGRRSWCCLSPSTRSAASDELSPRRKCCEETDRGDRYCGSGFCNVIALVTTDCSGRTGFTKKAVNMPGSTPPSHRTWSRHAHDLLGDKPTRVLLFACFVLEWLFACRPLATQQTFWPRHQF